jgi:GDP-L-fucose synthase
MVHFKKKIFVAGHKGMVGSAICRELAKKSNVKVITRTSSELDLKDQQAVSKFFINEQPDEVILAAAKVGGIYANNTYPADFIYENLQIQNNVIHQAHVANVQKLLFLGSSCIYPRLADQPMNEESLLTGKLEPTNEPYAISKIAGIKMCESYNRQYQRDYRSVMPTNLYGPEDNYNSKNSHVIPALIRRFYEAKINNFEFVEIWGTGKPKRDFLFVNDMAKASLFVHGLDEEVYKKNTKPMLSHINIGTGKDLTIKKLAETIKEITEFEGKIKFDVSKPDGTPGKLMDVSLIRKLGWTHSYDLKEGLTKTFKWFYENK